MAGLFGKAAQAALPKYDPSQANGSDKLMLMGAMLRDVGSSMRGDDAQAMLQVQSLLAQRQQAAQRDAVMKEISGGVPQHPQYVGAPTASFMPKLARPPNPLDNNPNVIAENYGGAPTPDGLNLPQVQSQSGGVDVDALRAPTPVSEPMSVADPRFLQIALQAPDLGLDLGDYIEAQKLNKPEYHDGVRVNPYDRNAPAFIPKQMDGAAPKFGPGGELQSIGVIAGAEEAAARMAGASEDAKQRAQAHYDITTLNTPDGGTVQAPRDQAGSYLADHFARRYGGGGPVVAQADGTPGSAPGGLGQSQTPAAKVAAETAARVEAEAAATARVTAPNVLASAEQAIKLIDELVADPELKNRTGWKAKLPALPGTAGMGIDARKTQLQGKVFLQAYGELKGAGAITEMEGKKAEQAVARLESAQTYEDYLAALKDLREVVAGGMTRHQQRTQLDRPGGGQRPAARTGGGPPPLASRKVGQTYDSPKGPVIWTGSGWKMAQ